MTFIALEKPVGQFFRKGRIHALNRLGRQSPYKPVNRIAVINDIRRLLVLVELVRLEQITENAIIFHLALDQTVTEPEGRGSESVGDGRIDLSIVLATEARVPGFQVEIVDIIHAQNDGQPFVISDVLHFRDDDPACLLVNSLIIPMRI